MLRVQRFGRAGEAIVHPRHNIPHLLLLRGEGVFASHPRKNAG